MKTIKLTVDGTTNHRVKNPQTTAQTVQRIFILVVAFAYAKFKFIAGHAFEGFSSGLQCMNKFRKANLRYLRERAASLQNSGQSLSQFYQFMPLQSEKWSPYAVIIAQIS